MSLQARTIRIISVSLYAALLSLLGGCSTWLGSDYQDPDVQLLNVEVVEAKLLEQEFRLNFRFTNPNDRSLPIRGINYSLQLNELKLADAEYERFFIVPAHDSKIVQVALHTNLWRHMRDLIKLLEKPDQPIRYQLQGVIKTGLMQGRRVHLLRNGEIIPGDIIPE